MKKILIVYKKNSKIHEFADYYRGKYSIFQNKNYMNIVFMIDHKVNSEDININDFQYIYLEDDINFKSYKYILDNYSYLKNISSINEILYIYKKQSKSYKNAYDKIVNLFLNIIENDKY